MINEYIRSEVNKSIDLKQKISQPTVDGFNTRGSFEMCRSL